MRLLMNLTTALVLYCICSGCTTTESSPKTRLVASLERFGMLAAAASEEEEALRMLAIRELIPIFDIKVGTVFVVGLNSGSFSLLQASKGEDWPMLELGLDCLGHTGSELYDKRTGKDAALVWTKVFSIAEGEAVVFAGWENTSQSAATYQFKFTKSPRGWELSSKTLQSIS